MSEIICILAQIESGDPAAAERLLPLVYSELRKLAVAKLAYEKPGQTLQATALVHEAYLRLLGDRSESQEHKKLMYLYLQGTSVTAEGINDLKAALPACIVEWDEE